MTDVILHGRQVLSNPLNNNIVKFIYKWNNYVMGGGEININMMEIFNEIITSYEQDLVFRIVKKGEPILLRNYLHYTDLIYNLRNFLRTTQGPRIIFGTWKDFMEGKIMWKIEYNGGIFYVRKTSAFVNYFPKDYWNKGHRGRIFSDLFFEKADIGFRGDTRIAKSIRRMIKDQIPELKGKNFQGSVYKLKYSKNTIYELMTLIWNRKVAELPSEFADGNFFKKFTVTRQPFTLGGSDFQFQIFHGSNKSIETDIKRKIIEIAKKTNTWDEVRKNVDIPKFVKKFDTSSLIKWLKKVILNKVSYKGIMITVEHVRSLGFDIDTELLWSSEYELHKVAAGALKDFNIRKMLGYTTPSDDINVKYGSLGYLLSNPDIVTIFNLRGKKVSKEVIEIKVLENRSSRVHPSEFLANLLLSKGYITSQEGSSIGKSLFFVKHDDPLLRGTTVGKTLKGKASALIFIDCDESGPARFAEIFNEVRLEYFGKRRIPTGSLYTKLIKRLQESSSAYGLDLVNLDDIMIKKLVSKFQEIAIKNRKTQYTFILEVLLYCIFENFSS